MINTALITAFLLNIVTVSATGTIVGTTKSGNLTPTLATHTTDDIVIVVSWAFSSFHTCSTATSGWTREVLNNSGTGTLCLFWKRATSGAETNPTISHDGSTDVYAVAYTISGAITTGDPFEVLGTLNSFSSTTSLSGTGLTTLTDAALVLIYYGQWDNLNTTLSFTSTDPASYTEDIQTSTAGTDGGIGIAYANRTTAGATGTLSGTLGTAASGDFNSVSVKPPGGGGPSCVDHSGMGLWGCF